MLNKKALAGTPSTPPAFVEDVFSTYLYSGNSSTQTITNGIDLSGKGGLVWLKKRNSTGSQHFFDTVRGNNFALLSNSTSAQIDFSGTGVTSFNSSGFSIGSDGGINNTGQTFCSWTFRKQPKFFDIITYTGNGSTSSRQIAHNLGVRGGAIIVKPVSASGDWKWSHVNGSVLTLNSNEPHNTATTLGGGFPALDSATEFSLIPYVGDTSAVNANGVTYVAYIFANNNGGFGAAGTDNVITCGSFTDNGTAVNLGYEPQFLIIKNTASAGYSWNMFDNMRGITSSTSTGDKVLYANTNAAETTAGFCSINATGFKTNGGTGEAHIYMAIRRPMKVPTDATKVFAPVATTGNGTKTTVTTGFPVDLYLEEGRSPNYGVYFIDRLRGGDFALFGYNTNAEANLTSTSNIEFDSNTTVSSKNYGALTDPYITWNFRRASGFFDEVCYTGTGSARTVAHNLTVVPELMIVKRRDTTANWICYNSPKGATEYLLLNSNQESFVGTFWNDTTPTSTVFSLGTGTPVNASGGTYVAYLFATCAGVSKVGSYTGTGTTLAINCGFTAGARFVLIKRTDSTGDWYVWDTARGIISGNDPYLLLNSTAAEVTSTDYIDPVSSGFEISSTAPAAINASGGSYIFLAIA